MIVTVTANTTLDHVVFVPNFQLNKTLRASKVIQSMGGKPTDASYILGELGIPSLALGFAAGLTGQLVEKMLHDNGVQTDFIQVGGESRRSIILVTDESHTTITSLTLEVNADHIAALRERFIAALQSATVVVLGGTLPESMSPDFYPEMIALAHQHHVPVIFDASEPYLSAGLQARPTFIKPNRDELGALVGTPITSIEVAYQAGRDLQATYGTSPIITLGDEGGLALLPDRAYRIPPLNVPMVSASGAGDAVLAGLAASIHRKEPIEAGLRLGFAAASAVIMMPGTAECQREDVLRLLDQVELIPIEGKI